MSPNFSRGVVTWKPMCIECNRSNCCAYRGLFRPMFNPTYRQAVSFQPVIAMQEQWGVHCQDISMEEKRYDGCMTDAWMEGLFPYFANTRRWHGNSMAWTHVAATPQTLGLSRWSVCWWLFGTWLHTSTGFWSRRSCHSHGRPVEMAPGLRLFLGLGLAKDVACNL